MGVVKPVQASTSSITSGSSARQQGGEALSEGGVGLGHGQGVEGRDLEALAADVVVEHQQLGLLGNHGGGSVDPSYEQLDINAELSGGGLVLIASGRDHDAAISIRQRDAVL